MPANDTSSIVAWLLHSTIAALRRIASRLARNTLTPMREKCSGVCRNARSCRVTTSGASVGHGTSPVAWATSTRPVARSTFGQPRRNHVWYSHGEPTGRCAMGIGGIHGSSGRWRWRPATPISRTSSCSAIASATRSAATAVPPGTSCQHCSNV